MKCRFIQNFLFLLVLIMLSGMVVAIDCYQYDGNETGCTTGNASNFCEWEEHAGEGFCDPIGCWDFDLEADCNDAGLEGLGCEWDVINEFCSGLICSDFDNTNVSACVNNTANLECAWDNSTGQEWCNDDSEWASLDCVLFDDPNGCFETGFCEWDGDNCLEPENNNFGGEGVDCFMFNNGPFCANVTGCSWSGSGCDYFSGPDHKTCEDITDSNFCNDVPFLDTCCSWSSGSCNATFSGDCWDNQQEPPIGAEFCEDYISFTNETMCDIIMGTPWFMPCFWDNQSTAIVEDDRCEFNSQDFFDGDGGFGDINSKSTCQQAGGEWEEETYETANGNIKTDSWCKMGFGTSSCDNACWACEFQPDNSNWDNEPDAENACESSSLGYCHFTPDITADNTFGWCDMPKELEHAGCGIELNCIDYEFFGDNSQSSCDNDENCKWLVAENICVGANAKNCTQTCGACNSESDCDSNPSCEWDDEDYICTEGGSGSDEEHCYNGEDEDGDGMIDCFDSDCMTHEFCGGNFGDVNCFQYDNDEPGCDSDPGCSWINDMEMGQAYCDQLGSNCWLFDENESVCNAEDGCGWISETPWMHDGEIICELDDSAGFDNCYSITNETGCNSDGNCSWLSDGWGSYCEAKPYTCWTEYMMNETGCDADPFCSWESDPFAPFGGFCDMLCAAYSHNSTQCNADPSCMVVDGFCEPEGFMSGGCMQNDGNKTACDLKDKCLWDPDPLVLNNLSASIIDSGWCNDEFMMEMFDGMDHSEPVMLDMDDCDGEVNPNELDICGFGINEMDMSYVIGLMVSDISDAAMCNGKILPDGSSEGVGDNTTAYYVYLDSDGDDTNNCDSDDGIETGFEFKFKYQVFDDGGVITTTALAYECGNEDWIAAPLPIKSKLDFACEDIGGPILAVDKESLESNDLFDKGEIMRFYATSGNNINDDSEVSDSVGPAHYEPGSVDFVFESCDGTIDMDGDGCLPAQDGDCQIFNEYGYIPFEDCGNGIDDDRDDLIDCDDPACFFDAFNCDAELGQKSCNGNDNSPPDLNNFEVLAYPDGAYVNFEVAEYSNITLKFYGTDENCSDLNTTLYSSELMLWHGIPLDQYQDSLGYALTPNMSYNLKYSITDVCGDILSSACSQFLTPLDYDDCGADCNTYLDDMDFVPKGNDENEPLGNLVVCYDLDQDGVCDYEKGEGDASAQETINNTGNVNIEFNNPNSTDPWAIECINGTIPNVISYNSSALDVNDSVGNGLVGMDSDEFNNHFMPNFKCEQICVTVPHNGDEFWHCINESEDSCTDVTAVATKVDSTADSSTWCFLPEVMGFSYFQSDDEESESSSESSSGGSSGGGGGGGGGAATAKTYVVNEVQFVEGYTKEALAVGNRLRFVIDEENHYITLDDVTPTSVKITVESEPQEATLTLNEVAKFELDGDNYYDLQITLLGINSSGENADLNVISIHESMPVVETTVEEIVVEEPIEETVEEQLEESIDSDVVVETLSDNVVVDEPEISDSAVDNFVQQIPVRTGLGWQQLGALLMLILTVIGVIIYLFEVRPRRS